MSFASVRRKVRGDGCLTGISDWFHGIRSGCIFDVHKTEAGDE